MTYRRLPKPFSPSELRALDAAARPDVAATMTMLHETGLRSAELCSITSLEARTWPQPPRWCRRAGCPRHSVMIRIVGKGDKERTVILTPEALRASRVMLTSASNGHLVGWSDRGLRYVIAEAGKAAGVHAHPHRFRHTAISEWVEAGTPIEIVAEMAGHSSTNTTRVYWGASETLRLQANARRARWRRKQR